jgi:hypothetical protein
MDDLGIVGIVIFVMGMLLQIVIHLAKIRESLQNWHQEWLEQQEPNDN